VEKGEEMKKESPADASIDDQTAEADVEGGW
jgi:hypothetical protein